LRWVGLRSYGVYLWHWPVFMLTRPQLDVPIDGLPLLALRLGATIVLAGLSYRFVETPIRTGALGRSWKALRESRGARRWQLGAGWTGAVGASVAFSALLGVAVAEAQPPAAPSYLSVDSVHTEASTTTPATDMGTSEGTTPETAAVTEKTAPAATSSGMPVGRITAVGDSVMVGAAGELKRAIGKNLDIDAQVGRQASAVIDILRQRQAAGRLGEVVVIDIGNNGPLNAEQFDEMMRVLKNVRQVVFVSVKVPRSWEQPNNDVLAEGVRRYPNAELVDWHAASANRPELFANDGYHLQIEGQQIYADMIATRLEAD
jgi:hypothetical protein